MRPLTFHDMSRFRICPYAYRLDADSGVWRITDTECMDYSVHDAILLSERRRLMREKVLEDDVLSAFWESWDRHFPDVYPPTDDNLALIRYGEKCMRGYIQSCRRTKDAVIVADVRGTIDVPGGSLLVPIDAVHRRGRTAVVCNYVTDPGVMSSEELLKDYMTGVRARWVLDNIPDCRNVVAKWEFLGSGSSVECRMLSEKIRDDVALAREIAGELLSGTVGLSREGDHCASCPHVSVCPRFTHELSFGDDPSSMSEDEGFVLVNEYSELQEKIDALKRRQSILEAKQKLVAERIISFSRSHGYSAVSGETHKAVIGNEKRVILPEDKTLIVERLKATGDYDKLSMVNYPRLRSDIVKGIADREIQRMVSVEETPRIHLRKRNA